MPTRSARPSKPSRSGWTAGGTPFNDPDYNLFPVLNLAVGGSGGGDPASGSYPAEMPVDWVRVF